MLTEQRACPVSFFVHFPVVSGRKSGHFFEKTGKIIFGVEAKQESCLAGSLPAEKKFPSFADQHAIEEKIFRSHAGLGEFTGR